MPSPATGVAAGTGGGACFVCAFVEVVFAAALAGAVFGCGLGICLAGALLTGCFWAGLTVGFGCLAGAVFAAGLTAFLGDDFVEMLLTAFDAPLAGDLLGAFADCLEELPAG